MQNRLNAVFADMNNHTPGCVAGVVREGHLVYANAFGMADLGQRVPMTTHTVLEIGSLSKQFTAASILLLKAEGKLSLDDPIQKYLPKIPEYKAPVTIRELLNHTSGIRDVTGLLPMAGVLNVDRINQADALAMLERQRHLNFPPGTEYEYSNSNYMLLAAIVKRVTGKTLPRFAAERIFRPLGMTHTLIRTNPWEIIPYRSRNYSRTKRGKYRVHKFNRVAFGNTAVNTTLGDFAKWLGNFEHPAVGGPSLIKDLETRGRLTDGQQIHYAAGLIVDDYRGLKRIHHVGSSWGFRSYFELYPQRHLGLITLCNGAHTRPTMRTKKMARIVLTRLPKPAPRDKAEDKDVRSRLLAFRGFYASADHRMLWRINTRRGKAFMGPVHQRVSDWSRGTKPGEFVGSIATVYLSDARGTPELKIGKKGGVLHRVSTKPAINPRRRVGRYRSRALQVTWTITAKGNRLVLHKFGSNPNRLDTNHTYRLRPLAANIYAAGRYTLAFGPNHFWLFKGRSGGIQFSRLN